MKKKGFKYLLFAVFAAFLTNCKPTKVTNETTLTALVGTNWELVGVTFYENDQYIERPNTEKGLTIAFATDGKLNYLLSVNRCVGTYTLEKNNKLTLQGGACTKMCCDTEFADMFQSALYNTHSYVLNGTDFLDLNCQERILKFKRIQ